MKLEDQVCSLDLSKKLKELGMKQDAMWSWWHDKTHNDFNVWPSKPPPTDEAGERWENLGSAPSVAELGEMLPTTIDNKYDDKTMWLYMRNMHHTGGTASSYCVWYANGRAEETRLVEERTEANARAKMAIYLIVNKLMEIKK